MRIGCALDFWAEFFYDILKVCFVLSDSYTARRLAKLVTKRLANFSFEKIVISVTRFLGGRAFNLTDFRQFPRNCPRFYMRIKLRSIRIILILSFLLLAPPGCEKETTILEPTPNANLFGTWLFTSFETSSDSLTLSDSLSRTYLVFADDGSFRGTDSCFAYHGLFHFEANGSATIDSIYLDSICFFYHGTFFSYYPALETGNSTKITDTTLQIFYGTDNNWLNFVKR
jgi:hypothetical protein